MPHLVARITGTAALLRASGVAFETIKFLGVATVMLGLSGVFMLMTFAVFALYGIFAAAVREHRIDRPRIVNRIRMAFRRVLRGAQCEVGRD